MTVVRSWRPRPRLAVPVGGVGRVLRAAARSGGFTVDELLARDRRHPVLLRRHAAMLVLRRAGLSFPQLGARLGGRDSTTAFNSVDRALWLEGEDVEFAALVVQLSAALAAAPAPVAAG
jgi:chromosomal replication initiation ATPase DnaA